MAVPKKLPESTRRVLEMSDDEIGSYIRDSVLGAIRRGVSDAIGGIEPNELYVLSLRSTIAEGHIDAAIERPAEALVSLASALALRGDTERAGRAYRAFFVEVFPLLRNAQTGKSTTEEIIKRNLSREAQGRLKREVWRATGLEIRNAERGWPKTNAIVAREISKRTGDRYSMIYREMTSLGLGAKKWRDQRRAENAVKQVQTQSAEIKHSLNKPLAKRR